MKRRAFFTMSAAALFLPHAGHALQVMSYNPALWNDLKGTDETIIMNFRASWSLTCQIKQELIAGLIARNPDYANLKFVDVDWDTYGRSRMTQQLKVERRSTLLVMKGGREVARLVNEPYERKVRALLDTALTA